MTPTQIAVGLLIVAVGAFWYELVRAIGRRP